MSKPSLLQQVTPHSSLKSYYFAGMGLKQNWHLSRARQKKSAAGGGGSAVAALDPVVVAGEPDEPAATSDEPATVAKGPVDLATAGTPTHASADIGTPWAPPPLPHVSILSIPVAGLPSTSTLGTVPTEVREMSDAGKKYVAAFIAKAERRAHRANLDHMQELLMAYSLLEGEKKELEAKNLVRLNVEQLEKEASEQEEDAKELKSALQVLVEELKKGDAGEDHENM